MPYSQTMIILFFDEVILAMSPFFSDELSTLIVNLDNINLDDVNFDEDNPDTIIMSDLQLGVIDVNNAEHRKKDISKELKPAAWHPRWWDWCFPEDEKKEIKPFFIE